jgi:hypothetical protein
LFCGLALLLITPHSDAVGLNDPEASCERLLGQLAHEALTGLEDERLVLSRETKHNEAGVLVRRVRTNVAEAAVESHKDPLLALHQAGEIGVLRTADALMVDGGSIVACRREQVGDLNREVLVDLESHAV